jgi:hypothetical protein
MTVSDLSVQNEGDCTDKIDIVCALYFIFPFRSQMQSLPSICSQLDLKLQIQGCMYSLERGIHSYLW